MSEFISREDAIEAVWDAFCYAYCDNCEKEMDDDLCGDCHRKYQNWSASRKTVEETIKAIPSANRPTGEWIEQESDYIEKIYLCSNCKNYEAWGETEKTPYCPNCGAEMEE